ncbi:flavin-containing monooxygenase [Salininema proteolyticum]|uniref:Flavin-containing monooxygenase n=1 Tax=Salininema proteolyticum TaxID=1607685 RepID=A0ABV8TUD0_9ACTN
MAQTASSTYDRHEAVCVIGAGACGLIAVKNLRENGFEVDCYERDTVIGGLWNPLNQHSPLYANTHTATPRQLTEIPDFPMPDHWPDYPAAELVEKYLGRYAQHFHLTEHIWFGSEVVGIEPAGGSRFDVRLKSAVRGKADRKLRYGAVIVATGHHTVPFTPDIPGLEFFPGDVVHSSKTGDLARWKGKRVLVIGGGVSGTDLASLIAPIASECLHSTRRDYRYLPRYLDGQPAQVAWLRAGEPLKWDLFGMRAKRRAARLLEPSVKAAEHLGIGVPDEPGPLETLYNGHYVEYVGEGSIDRVPHVASVEGRRVRFADDSEAEVDAIVCATGFEPGYDFCPPDLRGEDDRLLADMFSPKAETLSFVGSADSDSAMLPIAHWQSHAIAHWLKVRRGDPDRAVAFREAVVAETGHSASIPDQSSHRHRTAVDGEAYLQALGRIIATLEQEATE